MAWLVRGAQQSRTAVGNGFPDEKREQLESHGTFASTASEGKSAYTVAGHHVNHEGDTDNSSMDLHPISGNRKIGRAEKVLVALVHALAASLQLTVAILSLYDKSGKLTTGTWRLNVALVATVFHSFKFLQITYGYCKVGI
jgi:hypothetical protein